MQRLGTAGLRRFDVLTAPPHPWPCDLPRAGRRDLRRWLEAEDFAIESLNLPSTDQNLCSATEQMRAYSTDQWRAVFELCSDLGVGSVVMVPGRRPNYAPAPAAQCDAWLRAALEQLVPAAERAGVRIMLENHHQSPMPMVQRMASFLDAFGSRRLGIAYDVANGEFVGKDQADAIRTVGRWLEQVHLSDASQTRWDHASVGRASVDFAAVRRALTNAGFEGTSVIELTCDTPDRDMADARAAEATWLSLTARPRFLTGRCACSASSAIR